MLRHWAVGADRIWINNHYFHPIKVIYIGQTIRQVTPCLPGSCLQFSANPKGDMSGHRDTGFLEFPPS
jgi:hypothetical protein